MSGSTETLSSATEKSKNVERKKGLFYINNNFAYLWIGQSISILGDYIFDTTLILWITLVVAQNQPWAPLAVGGVFIATTVPRFVISPIAGVFVDRWDKKQTMLRMDLIRVGLVALLAILTFLPNSYFMEQPVGRLIMLGAIYVIVFCVNVCVQFFNPSRLAIIATIVEEQQRSQATGLIQVSMSLMIIIGPAVAVPLFFSTGVTTALIINACSFFLSFFALLAIRSSEARTQSKEKTDVQGLLTDLREGLLFFGKNRVLLTVVFSLVLVVMGSAILNALGVFFLTKNLHADASAYGALMPVFGAGAIIGAVIAGIFTKRLGEQNVFAYSILGWGILYLVLSRVTSLTPAFIILFFMGVVDSAANVAFGPIVLGVTPKELLGRIFAVFTPLVSIASTASVSLASLLASTIFVDFQATMLGISFGSIDTIFAVASLFTIVGGIAALFYVRRVRIGETNEELSKNSDSTLEASNAS